jgi:hypothetical protein
MAQIKLEYDDPTIFAICSGACCQHQTGKKVGNYFGRAYTVRLWKRSPTCENCHAPMRKLYEVEKG